MTTLSLEKAVTHSKFIKFDGLTLPITPLTIQLCAELDKQGNVFLIPSDPNAAQLRIGLGKYHLSKEEQFALKEQYICQTGDLDLSGNPFLLIYWQDEDFVDNHLNLNQLIQLKISEIKDLYIDKD